MGVTSTLPELSEWTFLKTVDISVHFADNSVINSKFPK